MTVFVRSWYGRVLVERVEGFATDEQWGRAYEEINGFERTLADEGTMIVKFWLHTSSEEQLKRFEARASDPLKSWKLTDEDWRNREKRPQYEAAVDEMVERTDQPHAPWRVVPAESKRFARVEVMRLVNAEIEGGMRRWGQDPPPPP
jgi:polyphosphate kinase 2 (PPK2 family)